MNNIERVHPTFPLYFERCHDENATNNVVVMFGWSNSQIRNVAKCASYWRNKGNFHILYYCGTYFPYLYFPWTTANLNKEFLPFLIEWDVLHKSDAQEKPLLATERPRLYAHVFSNGGAVGLGGMVLACEELGYNLNFDGIVIDSAPGLRIFDYHKVFTATQSNVIKRYITTILVQLHVCLLGPPFWLFYYLTGNRTWKEHVAHALLEVPATKCPRLFVYSKADELVPYTAIERMIAQSQDKGFVTGRLRFEETEHVKHWLSDTETYEREIDRFMTDHQAFLMSKI